MLGKMRKGLFRGHLRRGGGVRKRTQKRPDRGRKMERLILMGGKTSVFLIVE